MGRPCTAGRPGVFFRSVSFFLAQHLVDGSSALATASIYAPGRRTWLVFAQIQLPCPLSFFLLLFPISVMSPLRHERTCRVAAFFGFLATLSSLPVLDRHRALFFTPFVPLKRSDFRFGPPVTCFLRAARRRDDLLQRQKHDLSPANSLTATTLTVMNPFLQRILASNSQQGSACESQAGLIPFVAPAPLQAICFCCLGRCASSWISKPGSRGTVRQPVCQGCRHSANEQPSERPPLANWSIGFSGSDNRRTTFDTPATSHVIRYRRLQYIGSRYVQPIVAPSTAAWYSAFA